MAFISLYNKYQGCKIYSLFVIYLLIIIAIPVTSFSQVSNPVQQVISDADRYFNQNDYCNALVEYKKANRQNPGLEYPQKRINEINKLLEVDSVKNKLFENAILKGDKYFTDKKYGLAKREFQNALDLDPQSDFAKSKLETIREIYTDPDDQTRYNELIGKGDKLLADEKWDDAKTQYELALTVLPKSRYPKDKIVELGDLKAKYLIKEKQYDQLIASADQQLNNGKSKDALADYHKASDLFPKETYPKQKIAEIDNWLVNKNSVEGVYNKVIDQADQFYISRDFTNAKIKYYEALKIIPGSAYPKEMLLKTADGEAQVRSTRQKYDDAIASADAFFKKDDLEAALMGYKTALQILPQETYPKSQIDLINKQNADRKNLEEAYANAISNGDKAFNSDILEKAATYYQEGLKLKPNEQYPKDRLEIIESKLQKLKAIDDQYRQMIAEADGLLTTKKYYDAITAYTSAQTLKPNEQYPKSRIDEINKILTDLKSLDERYESMISEGDNFLKTKEYGKALVPYTEALKLKPAEQYPKDKISEINGILFSIKTLNDKYNKAVAEADAFLNAKKYNDATGGYTLALQLKPDEKYPKDKLSEIAGIVQGIASRNAAYEKSIKEADGYFESRKYPEALAAYKDALNSKPDESYPTQKITEINTLLGDLKTKEENYSAAIVKADDLLNRKIYGEARDAYQQALNIKTDQQYPKDKIAFIDKTLADIESNYKAAISEADSKLAARQYQEALTAYTKALDFKPDQQYPKTKIDEINKAIIAIQDLDQKYTILIEQGNNAFETKSYDKAYVTFNDASGLKPQEKYPKDKIAEILSLLESFKKLNSDYNKAIISADSLFSIEKYNESKVKYTSASLLKPEEKYPKERLIEIDKRLNEIAAREASYKKSIATGDLKYNSKEYEDALTAFTEASNLKPQEKYPKDKITEINAILSSISELNPSYNREIASADDLLSKQKYTEASESYKKASLLKPLEKYPKEKIIEINGILKYIADKEAAYNLAIKEGDVRLGDKKYEEAIVSFTRALSIKAGEKYPADKIAGIKKTLEDLRQKEENYKSILAKADNLLNKLQYDEAKAAYKEALVIKPGEQYPKDKIILIDKELTAIEARYKTDIVEADAKLSLKKYQEALSGYKSASDIKPGEAYPKQKTEEINSLLARLHEQQVQYDSAVVKADTYYRSKKLDKSLNEYNKAHEILPSETYALERSKIVQQEINVLDVKFKKACIDGDQFLDAKKYPDAISSYQEAIELKPDEKYPRNKVEEIHQILAKQKEEVDKMYAGFITEGDTQLQNVDYPGAKNSYSKASGLKPAEEYPRQKLAEIKAILEAKDKAIQAEYDKAVIVADKFYTAKVFDQAMEAYENCRKIKPDEMHPVEMIRKIQQYFVDHAIKDLLTETVEIPVNGEKKFNFTPVETRMRSNNFILIKAKATGNILPKVYLNYGKDAKKNGGIVLKSIPGNQTIEFIVRMAGQDQWYREDNNWISILSEGGQFEVSKIQIATGD